MVINQHFELFKFGKITNSCVRNGNWGTKIKGLGLGFDPGRVMGQNRVGEELLEPYQTTLQIPARQEIRRRSGGSISCNPALIHDNEIRILQF